MSLEYRKIQSDEGGAFMELVEYSKPPILEFLEPPEHHSPQIDRLDMWGLFDGEMHAAIGHEHFLLQIRNEWVDAAGSLVAVDPTHRRRGLTEQMLLETYREFRSQDVILAAGWPFDRSFYQQYDSETLSRFARVHGPTSSLPAKSIEGDVRLVSADDYDLLEEVYSQFVADYDLAIDRTEELWTNRTFHDSELYAAVLETDEPVGYITYRIEDFTFVIDDVAFKNPTAWVDLLSYVRRHSSQAEEFHVTLPTDVPVLDLVSDPESVDYEIALGPVGRVVDFPTAVESLSYGSLDTSFTLTIDDSVAVWNDDTYIVDVQDGTATVEAADREHDARMDIGTFTQLFVGYMGATDAAVAGKLTDAEPAVIDKLSEVFPTRTLFCTDRF